MKAIKINVVVTNGLKHFTQNKQSRINLKITGKASTIFLQIL